MYRWKVALALQTSAYGPECVKTALSIVGAKSRLLLLAVRRLQGHGLLTASHGLQISLIDQAAAKDTIFSDRHCPHQTLST
jgi:hypothetical protein